jgi:hypothetical protein
MIGRASVVPLPENLQRRLASPLKRVSDSFAQFLKQTAASLRNGTLPPPTSAVDAALQEYAGEVAALRGESLTRRLSGDVAERFFALGFSLEQMRQNLKDLQRCVASWAEDPASPSSDNT